jgi:hypothetical protein
VNTEHVDRYELSSLYTMTDWNTFLLMNAATAGVTYKLLSLNIEYLVDYTNTVFSLEERSELLDPQHFK